VPKKHFRAFLAALILNLTFAAPVFPKDASALRLEIDPTYPPMDSRTPDGRLTGFDVDLAHEICRRIAMPCEWIEMEFSGMIPAIEAARSMGSFRRWRSRRSA